MNECVKLCVWVLSVSNCLNKLQQRPPQAGPNTYEEAGYLILHEFYLLLCTLNYGLSSATFVKYYHTALKPLQRAEHRKF